jgi:hypothetical protein
VGWTVEAPLSILMRAAELARQHYSDLSLDLSSKTEQ